MTHLEQAAALINNDALSSVNVSSHVKRSSEPVTSLVNMWEKLRTGKGQLKQFLVSNQTSGMDLNICGSGVSL